ncbi:MAG: 4-(cytidine 5'-diphospho)-2-C-methyl-D-erythritol kinase [Oscillospiraceae bacterium]|jgi:4-diphosphocytidyl-2-C-methyl-D-erythritol kinase|nr:4-(cytidine 5'-diphospho)-2-C-methyl-D-erythritol kinase [Oscillospiraceae bacterium]
MKRSYNAYAKINLLLDVAGRRPDGYHSVATVMQSIDLHDTVTVEATSGPGVEILCDLPCIPTDHRNIAWKACKAFGVTGGLRITLEKRIPSQAGLGGGSADAAATLAALRDMFEPDMPDEELRRAGAAVGADVPFCLRGGCCLAEGIGERLTPLPCLPDTYGIEVLKPSAGINTALAYAALDRAGFTRPQTARAVELAERGDWEALFPLCENVFEQAVRLPGLARYRRERLGAGALLARLTGSGSAVYAIWRAGEMPAGLRPPMPCEGVFLCRAAGVGVERL